ncbi:MAG: dephospho-CoA kinase [Methylophilaceae bacterium]|nr:MAG: dephospho-CoA kinase [Methylophilaceae bacterium]
MFIVALTGGIGSGKSEASNAFANLDVPIVDLDAISHQLTAENQPLTHKIIAAFGQKYASKEGVLHREKMRKLIFDNPSARSQLNAILHPAIHEEATRQIRTHSDAPYLILAIPLLDQDSPYISTINRILVLDCDENTQINRVKQRNNLSEDEIKRIIQAQTPRQVRLSMADDVITNDGNIEKLHLKIEDLHQKYIKTCIVSKTIS